MNARGVAIQRLLGVIAGRPGVAKLISVKIAIRKDASILRSPLNKEWQSFDTETVNRLGGGHACLLIKSGGIILEFPEQWDDIWQFLKGGKYTCFNMDFDAKAICHEQFLPWRMLEDLAAFGRAKFEKWRFHYVPSKFFEVQKGCERFVLYDLQQFFGTSLAKASESHLGRDDGKHDIPRSWYTQMDHCLRDSRRGRVLAYAVQDVRATDGLRDKLVRSFNAVGIRTERLISAGSLALERYRKTLGAEPQIPRWIQNNFRQGFYGGRVETRALGRIGPCKMYDLHSAYPSEIAKLTTLNNADCIESGEDWKYDRAVAYGVYRVVAEIPLSGLWGPLAVRSRDGVVYYPSGLIETVCCRPALQTMRMRGIPFRVKRALEFATRDNRRIFEDIERLYLARQDPVINLAAKLVLNSIYGKLAETRVSQIEDAVSGKASGNYKIRSLDVQGRYTNFILASHITEAIRMKIWEALDTLGGTAYFCATDSILTTGELPTGPKLGEWGLKSECQNAVIFGCGRYYLDTAAGREIHMRGFEPTPESLAKLRNCSRRVCKLPIFGALSMKEWARHGCLEDLNVLHTIKKDFTIRDTKRHWPAQFPAIYHAFLDRIESRPWVAV